MRLDLSHQKQYLLILLGRRERRCEPFLRAGASDDDITLARSEEHILAMIAKITSPIPGPSSLHRPRRKTFRAIAQGVVFIQRIKYVALLFFSCDIPHLWMTGVRARIGAPTVRPDLPLKLRSRTCAVEGNSREDRNSRDRLY